MKWLKMHFQVLKLEEYTIIIIINFQVIKLAIKMMMDKFN